MNTMRKINGLKTAGVICAAVLLAFAFRVTGDEIPEELFKPENAHKGIPRDTMVWQEPGTIRGHVEGCRRVKDLSAEEKAKWNHITLEELEKRGALLCSNCPGINTPGRGNPHLLPGYKPLPERWSKPAPDEIHTYEFVPSPRAPLISMGPDGKLIYKPYSDRGDMLMDWSYCGYKNSNAPIPMVPVVETLEPLPGEASPVGNLEYSMGPDSSERIQAAIDKVAAMPADEDGVRGAVLLKKGTYYVTGSLNVKSGVVLRGEGDGDDGTILIIRSVEGGGSAIVLGDAEVMPVIAEEEVRITNSYLPSGSLKLDVADASGFKAGDTVQIIKTANEAWIEHLGMGERLRHIRGGKEGLNKRGWAVGAYQLPHFRTVVAVDGNTLTLDSVLPQSFDQEHGGGSVRHANLSPLDTHAGVEYLQVVSNYTTKPEGSGKEAKHFNFRCGIDLAGTVDSWVRGCTVKHVSFAAVGTTRHQTKMRITVRDSKSLEPIGPKAGGFRYAFNISRGSRILFYNCYSEDSRHCFSTGARVMGPNAFVNCVSVRGEQSEPHHRWAVGTLYDNVVTKDGNLAALNRGDSGSGHGWAGANTLFWNCDARSIVVFNPETDGENNFAIGYRGTSKGEKGSIEYSNTRAGYWQTPLEGKYYGFALMGNGHVESPDAPVKPDSLFTQQLVERIGKEKAEAVLK